MKDEEYKAKGIEKIRMIKTRRCTRWAGSANGKWFFHHSFPPSSFRTPHSTFCIRVLIFPLNSTAWC